LPWLAQGVTERGGGASEGAFATLNLGLHVGDDGGAVVENRRRVAGNLGFTLDRLVCAEQVHGGDVAVVTAADAGRGARAHGDALPGVDALATNTPGLLLSLFYADCVPLLLADPPNRAVAVAHAGWRGLVADVIANTVSQMGRAFGTRPYDLLAAIGPCIGPCCYEVGDDVAAHFPEDVRKPSSGGGRPHVDLAGAAARQLRGTGVSSGSITLSEQCTSCLPDRYFSHRRDSGRTGRIGALIGIRM
jgi:YfiH family protein